MARTWAGVTDFTLGGSGRVLARRVILILPEKWPASASTLPTISSALNSMSLVFMSKFPFDGFDCGAEPALLVRRQVLRFGLGVDVEKDDGAVLGKRKVDYTGAAGPALAFERHPHLAQAVQARDEITLLWVFQQVVLELEEVTVIGDLRDKAGEQRQLDEGQFHLPLQGEGSVPAGQSQI